MEDIRSRMLRGARLRALKAGVPFTLKRGDILVPSHCPVLGIPLTRSPGRASDSTPSLDRIIPQDGYVPGNVVVVSLRANRAKADLSIEELQAIAEFYAVSLKTSRVRHGRRTRTQKNPA